MRVKYLLVSPNLGHQPLPLLRRRALRVRECREPSKRPDRQNQQQTRLDCREIVTGDVRVLRRLLGNAPPQPPTRQDNGDTVSANRLLQRRPLESVRRAAVRKALNNDAVPGMVRIRRPLRDGALNQRANRRIVRARVRLNNVNARE